MEINKILLATDFSPVSKSAVEHALYLARIVGAKVYLLHAIEPIPHIDKEVDDEVKKFYSEIETDAVEKLDKVKGMFVEQGIDVESSVVIGKRWLTINNFAEQNNVDLIIIGSHKIQSESGQVFIGTTSHKVAMSSPCPVLIVRHN